MATEGKSKQSNSNKRRKNYLPHNKPVKKGAYPLRPGVEGFFITCDGGRERQASHEAINVIDSFFEELVDSTETKVERAQVPKKALNKITKFNYSDSSSSGDDDGDGDKDDNGNGDSNNGHPKGIEDVQARENKNGNDNTTNVDIGDASGPKDGLLTEKKNDENNEKTENQEAAETVEPPLKKQCTEVDKPNSGNLPKKAEVKSVDRLIEEEIAELGDKSKRRFNKLDTGCNGVVFIQMRKREGDPCPKDIVQHMMTSLTSTKKHVSRFLLRVLPVEASCYTSEEEIKRAIKPLIDKYFPVETEAPPRKFAVSYDARANTGVDRAKVIDAVAKSVPSVHKVDLANPDINIMVQIVKTVCLIGVVEKYKEFSKYNIRQLTS